MTLQDITTPKVLNFVNLLIADGWSLKRISFCRGYLRSGRGYTVYGEDNLGNDTISIYVPNRETSFKSNRYHAVIRLTKPQELPF